MAEDENQPLVVDNKIESLPLHDLTSWAQFEKLVCELIQVVEHLSPCHRYGTSGQAQGGIDIAGQSQDGRWHAFQVKHVAQFLEADAKNALEAFLRGPRPYGATRLVIVTSCKATRTQVRDQIHHRQSQNPNLTLELWDAEYLAIQLRSQPAIVARYFGDNVARRFCDANSVQTFYEAGGSEDIGCLVHDADPISLEVHEAISIDGSTHPDEPVLPTYFRRSIDNELDKAIDRALAGNSVLKVLLADSSTGKTRAAWEAIQRLSGDWRIWHPADQEDLLASLSTVKPHTVVWLNEINRYLLCDDPHRDEYVAARLTELLRDQQRAPVLILGTAWHVHWTTINSAPADQRVKTRALLSRCILPVPERFSEDEIAVLIDNHQRTDPRMSKAVSESESGHVIQYLAGGPAQLERYANGSPAVQAVLHAAMDARRLGHGINLPREFLRAAAISYLTPLQQDLVEPDWFPRAVQYLSVPCRGVRGPLAPVRGFTTSGADDPSFYRLADYVELHGRRHRSLICPEDGFWSASAKYSASARDKVALLRAALDRGRVAHGENLALAAAQDGEGSGLSSLAAWIRDNQEDKDPLVYYELAAELGDAVAQIFLGFRAENEGHLDEAERWYRAAASQNSLRWDAIVGLASISSQRGEEKRALELYNVALNLGFFGARAVEYQARWLARRGQHALALLLTKRSFHSGNTEAFTGLAWTYMYVDTPRAIQIFHYAMAEGDVNAPRELAWTLENEGDSESAEHFCELAVVLGETNTLRGLGMIRRSKGDYRSAAALFWRAYNLGLPYVLLELAHLREEEGDLRRAERLYWRALHEGQSSAAQNLVQIMEAAGRTQQAESLAAGSIELLEALALARAERGEHESAEKILISAISQGNPHLLISLSQIRSQQGDLAGAEKMLHQAQDSGITSAARWLRHLEDGIQH